MQEGGLGMIWVAQKDGFCWAVREGRGYTPKAGYGSLLVRVQCYPPIYCQSINNANPPYHIPS